MTKQVQRRRGTATQHTSFTGAEGEISVNTTNKSVHVHDGVTTGGIEAARADLANVSDANLNAALSGNTLAALTVTTVDINGGTIDGAVIGGSTPSTGSFTTITVSGTVDGRDVSADGAKLDGIEAGADVTDAANVTAAGALMDSELTNIAAVKALNQGVATTDDPTFTGVDLAAIATSKAVTAVDVFVYDTSKDSDGGAWRKRTQHTSWYNETLNTATRGSRREFPAVAVIVAEASKVTIYDGDDPSLPMWMSMVSATVDGTARNIWRAGRAATSVTASNGVIAFGVYDVGEAGGVVTLNMVSDLVVRQENAGYTSSVPVVRRNSGEEVQRGTAPGSLIATTVNDVAMTVLPNAPIDPATGLPVPTIAVATDGGVSVIKDDGTVVTSSRSTSYGGLTTRISFNTDYSLVFQRGGSSGQWFPCLLTSVDDTDATDITSFPKIAPPVEYFKGAQIIAGDVLAVARGSWYGHHRLMLTKFFDANYQTGMQADIRSDFNTGWMNGDIKGAFLSSTDTASLVGSGELVTNGTFDTDVSGWSVYTGDETLSSVSGRLRITFGADGVTGTGFGAHQAISGFTVGKTYVLSVGERLIGTNGACGVRLLGGPTSSSVAAIYGFSNGANETVSFVATQSTYYLNVYGGYGTAGTYVEADNISVKLADADRSVNNKGLVVSGSITRTPVATGAELVAYSGFSASNYLEQPYNSALDFGTGDFCVMGWFKRTATSGNILDRGNGSNSNNRIQFHIYTASEFRVVLDGTPLATSAIPSGVWTHLTYARRNGVGYLYVNSNLGISGTQSGNVSGTNATKIGISQALGDPCPGSLALLRISATAPTAEQIKKIYEDEKVLFQENAACTLYGTSDAVTALAHDSDTGILSVGTSAGRSDFQGLRRVNNTTTAVGVAISAAGGMIVEE